MRVPFPRLRLVHLFVACSAVALTGCVDDAAYYRSDEGRVGGYGVANPEFVSGQRPGYGRVPDRRGENWRGEAWREGPGRVPDGRFPNRRYPPNLDRQDPYDQGYRQDIPSVYDQPNIDDRRYPRRDERDYRRW